MPLVFQKMISPDDVAANPAVPYVFGDNMDRHGTAGQASYGRGKRNAVGIPTKWAPRSDPAAFFADEDFDRVRPSLDEAFDALKGALERGQVVVWPLDGVGTGYARLQMKAPVIWEHIQSRFERLKSFLPTSG